MKHKRLKLSALLFLGLGLTGLQAPRWRGSVTRANISIHIANNKVTYE